MTRAQTHLVISVQVKVVKLIYMSDNKLYLQRLIMHV